VKSNSLLRQAVLLGKQLGLLSNVNDPSYQANGAIGLKDKEVSKATASWGLFALVT
jgi:hypothetical protein